MQKTIRPSNVCNGHTKKHIILGALRMHKRIQKKINKKTSGGGGAFR